MFFVIMLALVNGYGSLTFYYCKFIHIAYTALQVGLQLHYDHMHIFACLQKKLAFDSEVGAVEFH